MSSGTPAGWRGARLGEVADLFNGKAGGSGGTWLRTFKTRHVYDGFLRLVDPVFAPDDRAPRVPRLTYLRCGDTLTPNMAHGTIGRVAYVHRAEENWTVDGQVMVIRPKDDTIVGRYLFDWMSRPESKKFLVSLEKGGAFDELRGQTHIYRDDVATLPVLLPPVTEQRKIAAILSAVDDAIGATQAVIDQVQVVKKALMAELLTRGLPGRHVRYRQTNIGEVPESWRVVPVGDVLEESAYGTSTKCDGDSDGLPVLRIPNVVSGRVTTDDLKYARLIASDAERFRLRTGDVLVIRTNGNPAYVGRSAVVPSMDGVWLYASYLIRLRVKPDLVKPTFLHEALRSEPTRKTMQGAIRTSAGNYNLNMQGIAQTLIPLPPLDEQEGIAASADSVQARLDAELAAIQG